MAWQEPSCLVGSENGDDEGSDADPTSPAHASSHILDVEHAFSRRHSFPPAPKGYVHIDDATLASDLSSGALSGTFSTSDLSSTFFGSPAGSEAARDGDVEDGDYDISMESGPSPSRSPGSYSPSRLPPLYEHSGFLPTIAEVSEEDSPRPASRFWNTRDHLVKEASARGGFA
jgi:hypothetical protein